jgi:hypothetical protein
LYQQFDLKSTQIKYYCLTTLNLQTFNSEFVGGILVKRYDVVRSQSSDGEIHLIVCELSAVGSTDDLNETQIREIMKEEAQKPLHLAREYE